MKTPQIPPLNGCSPLGFKIINGDSTRKQSDELFEAPFNLAGELLDNSLTAEGEAQVRARAEAEARKAQETFPRFGKDWR
jgi:hypothetical protein